MHKSALTIFGGTLREFCRAFANLQKVTIIFVVYVGLSVRPSAPLPLNRFSWNLK